MCGGGGSSDAVREQERAEARRQAQVNGIAAQVRNVFNSPQRQAEINQYEADTARFYQNTLDQQHGNAARELKFALARTGQTGGQVAVDKGADLTRTYNEGTLKVTRAAAQAASRLRASDQDTQGRIISMAQAGLDMTNATQLAFAGLRDNALAAKAEVIPEALGQAFAGLADTYQFSQEAKAYNRGYEQAKTANGTPVWMNSYGAGGGSSTNSMPPWMIGGG